MAVDSSLLTRFLSLEKTLLSSLRLKDVLDAAATQFAELANQAKVAIFLADSDNLSLKLMNMKGYTDATAEQLRTLSFTSESLLKIVVQQRQTAVAASLKEAPDISYTIMQREGSKGEIALPLIAANLLVGAVLIDVTDPNCLARVTFYKELADLTACHVANAILFGRSEYEREKLGTLYRTAVALNGSSLKLSDIIQIATDTALVLANTSYCAVLLVDSTKQSFHIAAMKGLDGSSLRNFDLSYGETIAGLSLKSKKTQYLPDVASYQHTLPCSTGGTMFGSALALPMVCDDQVQGVIVLFTTALQGFHREQIELLESLVHQVAVALKVAFTHESAMGQAVQDAHTGLSNRGYFEESFAKEIERSARHKHELALLLVDIDHLSRINDLLGQEKGDEAIRHIARIVKTTLRDIDVSCRYGSEEFAILLPETPSKNAQEVAERLRQKIRSEAAPGIGMITVSIGLATFPAEGQEPAALLKMAEEALDVAKFEGRDRVKHAESHHPATGPIPWNELVRQAKLAIVNERQSKLQSRLTLEPMYAPWMNALPNWGNKKKSDDLT